MSLTGNIYKQFIQKYHHELSSHELEDYEMVFVDFDIYQSCKIYQKCIFKIHCRKLPSYVKNKIRNYKTNKVIFKHNNLCTIALI